MFRNDCFGMVVKINEKDIILSNEKTKEDINKYISSLNKYYKINSITIDKENLILIIYLIIRFYKLYLIKSKVNSIKISILCFK